MTSGRSNLIVAVGGLIAGAFDIVYAIVFFATRGVPPGRVLQSVASGLLGAAAFEGGAGTAGLGLLLHFLIAVIFAFFFAWVAKRAETLLRHPWAWGLFYGFCIYWLMNLVVLPLSAFPRKVTFTPVVLTTGLLVHLFLIGVPIALATRKAVGQRASSRE